MDGTTKDKTVPVEKGQTGETEAPGQREGYTFLGWRGDNDRLYSAGSEVTPEADMVMTAEWGADSTVYTLTISVTGGGSVVRVEDGQEYDIASGTGFLEGDQEMCIRDSAEEDDMDDIGTLMRCIEGVEVGVLMKETPQGAYKVSFRSAQHINVSEVAQEFGGGGHRRASGCLIAGPEQQAEKALVEAIELSLIHILGRAVL